MRSLLLAVALGIAALAALSPARSQDAELGAPIALDDPSGHALDALHTALREAAAGRGRARLVFYGASHTAEDQYASTLRDELAQRAGRSSIGLVMPVDPPWDYDSRTTERAHGGAWRSLRIRRSSEPVAILGAMGQAAESERAAWATVRSRGDRVSAFDVAYLERAGGGTLGLRVDDGEAVHIATSAARETIAHRVIEVSTSEAHTLRVSAEGDGPVRLLSVELVHDAPGVTVDALGVPGAHARDALRWDEAAWAAELARLGPDLVALAYGTNESSEGQRLDAYERDVTALVERVRRAAPAASCLLIGPSEWPRAGADGALVPRPRTAQLIEAQRRVARAHGCAFFDMVRWMGGPGSMQRWLDAGLALSDHVHFGDEAHARLGHALAVALRGGAR